VVGGGQGEGGDVVGVGFLLRWWV